MGPRALLLNAALATDVPLRLTGRRCGESESGLGGTNTMPAWAPAKEHLAGSAVSEGEKGDLAGEPPVSVPASSGKG